MKTGSSGYQERSRVQGAAKRVPSVVYQKSQGPGTGTFQPADEVDPMTQASKYVGRVAGASELQWAQRRMVEYDTLRELRLKVANFRHELLQQAAGEAFSSKQSSSSLMIVEGAKSQKFVAQSATAQEVEQFLTSVAGPEQLASLLPESVVSAAEEQVVALKEALHQDYQAQSRH